MAVPVLVAAAGAGWEAEALDVLARGGPSVVLHKRCVDLADLLASASTGLASVALVSPSLGGLDADSVSGLHRAGLGVLLVAADTEIAAENGRLHRLGIRHVLEAADLDRLPAAVRAAADDAGPTREDAPPTAADAAVPGAGRLVAVWGPAGAPGRTTVAVGLAAELAGRGETFLVDADPYGGTVAQHLGVLDEVSGLLAAARAANSGRLDGDALAGYAREVGTRLRVLTGLPRADRWAEVRGSAFQEILDVATGLATTVVVDVGFNLEQRAGEPFTGSAPHRNQMTLSALEHADEVVVVGAADPVGLARLARGLVELHDVLPSTGLRVVVNRNRPSLGWAERDIVGMVEGFLTPRAVHFLPEDRAAADRALMAGRSLAESGDCALSRALADLARAVAGEPAAPGRHHGGRRLARRARRR
ncbi:MAG TPA: hypothetical protein VFJ19_01110 [Nocardioidaceae bacterium]|nr:hypothetical protein [Nocardioidaceae bacterium]